MARSLEEINNDPTITVIATSRDKKKVAYVPNPVVPDGGVEVTEALLLAHVLAERRAFKRLQGWGEVTTKPCSITPWTTDGDV